MKPLIIYHGPGCMDGAAAALAAWLKFGDEAEYRPASYGDPAPTDEEVRGRDVYVLDFSYPRAELERMIAVCGNDSEHPRGYDEFIVLDHHKTAQADLADLPFCVFDIRKSGAVMAWEYFHCSGLASPPQDEGRVPELFRYAQDRDLWQWALPHSREVSAALAASGALTDFRKLIPIYKDWHNPYDDGEKADLISRGATILCVERQMIERIAATAEEVEIQLPARRCFANHICEKCKNVEGVHVFALAVTSAVLQSEVGETLALESARRGRDAVGVVYYRDGKSGKWRVSLRSRDGYDGLGSQEGRPSAPDVSVIAKSFGGGGHKQAAGFECDDLPWMQK